ncbi:MAG: hypothetical protein K8M05_19720 [Deltaproteobacteria bacterium]|nr:hypothetical protein [Kofleriaceae bacterium]
MWASAAPREIEPLIAAVVEVFEAFEEKPARMFVTASKVKQTAYHAARFATAVRGEETLRVTVKGAGDARVLVSLHLRDDPEYAKYVDHRHVELIAPTTAPDDSRLIRFLTAACATYPVAHGGIMRAATVYHAGAEARVIGSSEVEDATDRRIGFDAMNAPRALDKLRRLYPVTIIGPDIWAKLPPIPDVEPRPKVEDLGNCKMLTCWPELVDVHDLQFLLGTRELRRWLWPFTIQNPADDPDEVDHRLRWAELLPW